MFFSPEMSRRIYRLKTVATKEEKDETFRDEVGTIFRGDWLLCASY